MWQHDITLTADDALNINIGGYYKQILRIMGQSIVIPLVHLCINSKNLLVRKNSEVASCYNKQRGKFKQATPLVLAASDSICLTLSIQELYLRFNSAIQHMVASLTKLLSLLETHGILAVFLIEWLCLSGLAEFSS